MSASNWQPVGIFDFVEHDVSEALRSLIVHVLDHSDRSAAEIHKRVYEAVLAEIADARRRFDGDADADGDAVDDVPDEPAGSSAEWSAFLASHPELGAPRKFDVAMYHRYRDVMKTMVDAQVVAGYVG